MNNEQKVKFIGFKNRFQKMQLIVDQGVDANEFRDFLTDVQQFSLECRFDDPEVNQLLAQLNGFAKKLGECSPAKPVKTTSNTQFF